MKSTFLKLGMPFMVFLFAFAFAFASEMSSSENDSNLIPGYIYKDGKCETATRDCSNDGSFQCTEGGQQVYMNQLSDTVCSVELTHWSPL